MDQGLGSYAFKPDIPILGSSPKETTSVILQPYGTFQEQPPKWNQKLNHTPYITSPVTSHSYSSVESLSNPPVPSRNYSSAENLSNLSVLSHNYSSVESTSKLPVRSTGNYFMGNVHAHHIGLAGCGVERPEELIKSELERLHAILQQSERYQKYREKQPVLTQPEMIAREQAEREEAERKGCQVDEKKAVWPEFLEDAFWRGKFLHVYQRRESS